MLLNLPLVYCAATAEACQNASHENVLSITQSLPGGGAGGGG
jgi:hypothetical protein